MKKTEQTLTLLTAAAILCGGGLWIAELVTVGASAYIYLGLACAAAAVILLAALWLSYRRRLDAQEQRRREALDAMEKKYAQALDEVQARSRAEMDSFRSSLTHSLRMPVAIIQGYAELLTSGVITDMDIAMEYLQKIIQRSQFMTEAISRQSSAAEVADSSKLAYTDLDLMELVRQAAADMQTAAADQGVKIQVVSPEERLPMRADAYLLNRVLFNLLENALKYMGRPGVITLRVLRQEGTVSILVQDDGMGLATEETARIFEPHYQGSNHMGGQGYGLYLVKRAIENHGGTVAAQSAPGLGMRISMTLPLFPGGGLSE